MTDRAWAAALDVLERQLDGLERVLDDDDWDEPPALTPVGAPPGPVPAELVAAVQQLAARVAALERRMSAELSATADQLSELAVRRRAARGYHQSEVSALADRMADDG